MSKNDADPVLASALALALQRRRGVLGLSQEKVAQRASISRNQYQLYEKGLSVRGDDEPKPANPTLSTLKKLSNGLGITLAELMADLELPPTPVEADMTSAHRARRRPRR